MLEHLTIDGVKEFNANKISNRLASYFASVGKRFANQITTSEKSVGEYLKLLQSQHKSLFFTPTCAQEIIKIVSKLPSKTSSGHDNISNVLLKEIIHPLAPVLLEVFNKSMTMGEFPTVMKLAEIVERSQNTILLASTQEAIKGTVQYSTGLTLSSDQQLRASSQ